MWPNLMTGRVEEAMHYWGKLLKYVGEDRIVWGTDCLWFGCPQPIIQAFRAFEISQEFQDKYGYPALTQARKEKILGQNAAKLQNVRKNTIGAIKGCHSDFVGQAFLQLKRELDEEFGKRRDMIRQRVGSAHAPRVPGAARGKSIARRSLRSGSRPAGAAPPAGKDQVRCQSYVPAARSATWPLVLSWR